MRKMLSLASLIVLTTLGLTGCNRGTFVPQGDLHFTSVTVSQVRATIGDPIEISWDYENVYRLAAQRIKTVRLLFQGLCPPDFCPEPIGELNTSMREASFIFAGPVTIVLEADDDAGGSTNVVFDIKLDEEFSLQAEVTSTNVQYPRLGYPVGTDTRIIEFSQFLGIYELPDDAGVEDPVIDWLANNPSVAAFLPPNEAFRALSPGENESNGFDMRQGSGFPDLDDDFRDTPDGKQFTAQTNADVVLFGGALAYDGTVTTIKAAEGEVEARTNVSFCCEAIFVAVDLRTDDNGALHVANIHIGNLNQGLVLSVFYGFTAPVIASTLGSEMSLVYDVQALGEVGIIEGFIKGSVLSDDKFTTSGDPLYLSVAVNLQWYAPFYPDADLGGRAQIN